VPANDAPDRVATLKDAERKSHATNTTSYARTKEKSQPFNFARENVQEAREDDSKLVDWHVMSEQSAESNAARVNMPSERDANDRLHAIQELLAVRKHFTHQVGHVDVASATHLHGACIGDIRAPFRTLPSKTAPLASTLVMFAPLKLQDAA
jgi:hypothetical protein